MGGTVKSDFNLTSTSPTFHHSKSSSFSNRYSLLGLLISKQLFELSLGLSVIEPCYFLCDASAASAS